MEEVKESFVDLKESENVENEKSAEELEQETKEEKEIVVDPKEQQEISEILKSQNTLIEAQSEQLDQQKEQDQVMLKLQEQQVDEMQAIQETLSGDESPEQLLSEVVLGNEQFTKFAESIDLQNQAYQTDILFFNLLIGLVIGYVAVRGFFDSWRV